MTLKALAGVQNIYAVQNNVNLAQPVWLNDHLCSPSAPCEAHLNLQHLRAIKICLHFHNHYWSHSTIGKDLNFH